MSDTTTQLSIESWIVGKFLRKKYCQAFKKKQLQLLWGGKFQFDAVSEDDKTAVCISTSQSRTASGKGAIGKYHKIKADALYLEAAVGVSRRIMAFTDPAMKLYFEQEKERGRFPLDIELLLVALPRSLRIQLQASVDVASAEVSPRRTIPKPKRKSRKRT